MNEQWFLCIKTKKYAIIHPNLHFNTLKMNIYNKKEYIFTKKTYSFGCFYDL